MTVAWLIVWLICGTEALVFAPEVNGWATWLLIAAALDLSAGAAS
jgi:hypothetical protein